jgi:hypothetical protein
LTKTWCLSVVDRVEYDVWYSTVSVEVEINVKNNVFVEFSKIPFSVISIAVAAHCLMDATDLLIVSVHCAMTC